MTTFLTLLAVVCCLNPPAPPSPQQLDDDYKIQGEYSGMLDLGNVSVKMGLQVIAMGDGVFSAVGFHDGLPGDGWNGEAPIRINEVKLQDGKLRLEVEMGSAVIQDGVATIYDDSGNEVGKLQRVNRKSRTLGKLPLENSRVLFGNGHNGGGNEPDAKRKAAETKYANLWNWKGNPPKISKDGWLMQGTASRELFGDHRIHIEFRLPYMPKARGQQRGNSGIYLQGRYEVQMLDSFGLTGKQNECGGIYSIKKPDVNMCFPPMSWQTYDIEFHAAKFEGGKKVKNAWMTVLHNGVTIHDHVELPKTTTAAPVKLGDAPGPVYLQDHGNPVRYRNIWVQPLNPTTAK